MDKFIDWIVGLGVLVIGWLVNKQIATNKEIADIKTQSAILGQQIEDHEKTDSDRFARIEAMFAEHRRQFIDIMQALNHHRGGH